MRRRLFTVLGALAVVGLLAAPVSAAAPVENGWDTITGASVFDQCTGETVDFTGRVHTVAKENASPELSVHSNTHLVAIGELSGEAYVYDAAINSPVRVAADGSYTVDQRVHASLVSTGRSPNLRITVKIDQVFDSGGNLISSTVDVAFDCQGS